MPERTLQILEDDDARDAAPGAGDTPVRLLPETAGRYLLQGLLGKGCMGEVWRAEDPQIGRAVAVKILRVPEGLDPADMAEWEARFLREARAAGSLSHPGIVAIHDVGKTEDGRPFIVMELVEGRSLDAVGREGPRPRYETVLGWGIQLAEALEAAHRRGIVHRDIKPANVLIDGDGRARIADFGIARLSESDLTREGSFLGSPAFSAPEQIRAQTVDGRADLFSLGATLYAILTGARPFQGKDMTSAAFAVCYTDPAPPSRLVPGLPSAVDRILLKSLAKDPDRRQRSGRELASEMRACLEAPAEGTMSAVRRAPSPATAIESRRSSRRQATPSTNPSVRLPGRSAMARAGLAAAIVLALAGGGIGAIALFRASRGPARSSSAPSDEAKEERPPEGAAPPALPPDRGARVAATTAAVESPAISRSQPPSPVPGRKAPPPASPKGAASAWPRGTDANPVPPTAARRAPAISKGPTAPPRAAPVAAAPPRVSAAPSRTAVASLPVRPPTPSTSAATAAVTVHVVHGLEDGEISIWSDDRLLLKEPLRAQESDVGLLGSDIFTRRKGTAEWILHIPAGKRSLKVRIEGDSAAVSLEKEMSQQLEAGSSYTFDVRVRSFPKPHLTLDWGAP